MDESLELLNKFNFLLIYNNNSKEDEKQYKEYLSHLNGKTKLLSFRNVKSFLSELGIKTFVINEKILTKIPNIFDTLPESYEHFALNKYLIDFAINSTFSEHLLKLISINLNSIIENDKFLHVTLTFLAILFTIYFKNISKDELENTKKYLLEYLDDFQCDDFIPKDIAIFKHLKFLLYHQNNLIKTKAFSLCNSLNIPLSLTKMISLSKQNANDNFKNLILFLGPTGSGKTTLINYLSGVEYQRHHLHNFLIPKKGSKNVLQVGYGSSSETITPQSVRLENLDLCDTAGFFDNREGDIGICSALSIPIIISHSEKVQAIVVVLESESLDFSKGNRGEIFRKVCQNFGQLIKDFNNNYDKIKNILFVVNDKSSQMLNKDEFKLKLENFLSLYEQETTCQKSNDLLDEYELKLKKLSLKLKIFHYCHSFLNELELNQVINDKDLNMFIQETNKIIQDLNDEVDIINYLYNLKTRLESIKEQGSKSLNVFTQIETELIMKLICEKESEINKLKTLIEEKNAEKLIIKLMLEEFNEQNRLNKELNELIDSNSEDELELEKNLTNFLIKNGLEQDDSKFLVKELLEQNCDDFFQELMDLLMVKKQNIFLIKCLKSNDQQQQDDKDIFISRLKDICEAKSEIDKSLFYFNLYQNQFEKVIKFIDDSIEEISDVLNQMNTWYKNIQMINRDIQIKRDEISLNEEKLKNLMSLKENIPIHLTKENFRIYQFNQTQLEIQKQFYFDINRNIEHLETSMDKLQNEDCVDFHSEFKIEKRNILTKMLRIPWTSWLYEYSSSNSKFSKKNEKKLVPIERVELSCIKDHNGKIMFKTPIGICQKSDNLNKIGAYYSDDDLGLTEIAPGIQQVTILTNPENLFTKTGDFKINKFDLAKGILKVKFSSEVNGEGYACVRVFVKPKEFEDNKSLIISKQKSIETYKQNLKKIKLKIQELEKEQENEKLFLEALQKGINASEKTDQLINILETLGYDKQMFLDTFFPEFLEVSRLENVAYLNKIQSLFDLSDDDLAERYNQLNKNQLKIYFYGDENQNRTVVDNGNYVGIVSPGDLDCLINAAHLTGVSFLLLNKILSKLNKYEKNSNKNDLKSNLAFLIEEREKQIKELDKWKSNYERKNKKIELLDYILCFFENQENSVNQIDRYNSLKNCESVKNILENKFDNEISFIQNDDNDDDDINELKMVKVKSQSISSLESIASNIKSNPPLKAELFNSITDDFKFQYISYENSQNAYCASICINRIKSAKNKMYKIIEFYLPQLIQSAKKEKFINEKDESYTFVIEKLLICAASCDESIWVKMYWHLITEIEHLEAKLKETIFTEKDLNYFKNLLNELMFINSELYKNQEFFVEQLKKLNSDLKIRQNSNTSKSLDNIELKPGIHHLFDFNHEITHINIKKCQILPTTTKSIKICFEHSNNILYLENSYNYFIYETNDDYRLDHLIQRSIVLIDNILKKEDIDLKFFTYNVHTIGLKKALIQYDDSSYSLMKMMNTKEVKNVKDFLRTSAFLNNGNRLKKYEEFLLVYKNSLAGYKLISYLYGINQSLDNVLINKLGQIFCINLRYLYGNDPKIKPPKNQKNANQFLLDIFSDNELKEIIELVIKSFLILRKERKILINFFSLMLNSTITKSTLDELIARFLITVSDQEIKKVFKDKIVKDFKIKDLSNFFL
ncbi:unnamed protein product [Brachionus calyciflorus]|uniref:PI3K/PI4K catalytic domain-containing protein n=1 Tax=Brachionus calyciflorus TaxID=104777 RepID=A0A813TNX4_9BILA|nr:unnamed protein product [Brachionus calyciflorus]